MLTVHSWDMKATLEEMYFDDFYDYTAFIHPDLFYAVSEELAMDSLETDVDIYTNNELFFTCFRVHQKHHSKFALRWIHHTKDILVVQYADVDGRFENYPTFNLYGKLLRQLI